MNDKDSGNIKQYFSIDFITLIETRFGDPITAINTNLNNILIGTTLGQFINFDIKKDEKYFLFETEEEEITDITFYDNKEFSFCVGDQIVNFYRINEYNEKGNVGKYFAYVFQVSANTQLTSTSNAHALGREPSTYSCEFFEILQISEYKIQRTLQRIFLFVISAHRQ